MNFVKLEVGDILVLKKNHPCGGNTFEVLRVGSDLRIRCQTCKRDVTVSREKLEKSVKELKKKSSL